MNKYESVVIMSATAEDNKINEVVDKITNLIKENGNLEKIENLGKKKLAYEIKLNKEGLYYVFEFESNPEFIQELERIYRITDEVIKFIVVRKDD